MFQMLILTSQGARIHYGRPKTAEQCDKIRRTSQGVEGQHYWLQAI